MTAKVLVFVQRPITVVTQTTRNLAPVPCCDGDEIIVENTRTVKVPVYIREPFEIDVPGIQGPEGPPGPQGPPGPAGGSPFVYDQMVPATLWLIVHNLNRFPSVTVVDSANEEVEGAVEYVDANTIRLEFNAPFSGKAFLN